MSPGFFVFPVYVGKNDKLFSRLPLLASGNLTAFLEPVSVQKNQHCLIQKVGYVAASIEKIHGFHFIHDFWHKRDAMRHEGAFFSSA
jgi:hypothetical protein